jgi:hypothetical protein
VEVTVKGDSALWSGVGVSRTVAVDDNPWIDIEHLLYFGPTTGPYLLPAFWFSNAMKGLGRTFVSGPAGVLDYPRWPQNQSWCHEPTDGWIAWTDGTAGLAFITDVTHLRHVRICHQDSDRIEWIRRRIFATTQTTNVRLVPFSGLARVDGVGDAGVVAVDATQQAVVGRVYPLLTGRANLTIDLIAPNGSATPFGRATANVVAGRLSQITVPGRSGTGVWWRGTLEIPVAHGVATTTFSVPTYSSASYLLGIVPPTPQWKELPRADGAHRQPPRSFRFDAVPAPLPPPWLQRQSGRISVLAFAMAQDTASLLALARMFDFDLTLPFIPRTAQIPTGSGGIAGQRLFYELGDRYDTLFGDELIASWTDALSASRNYDVILLAGGWELLPQTLQAAILARVHAGTGLVTIRRGPPLGPNPETATLEGLLPLHVVNTSDYRGPFLPADDRTVRGLPWTIFPTSGWIFNYRADASATVLVQIDYAGTHLPLLARTSYGKGRVLDLVWGPFVLLTDANRVRTAAIQGIDTTRYDLALVARLIQDAAGLTPAIAVRNVGLVNDTAAVHLERVRLPRRDSAFDLFWVARDRFGLVLGNGQESPASFPASNFLSFAIPKGTWMVDVVVQVPDDEPGWGAGGRTLDFAISTAPQATVLGRSDRIPISPVGPATATHYIVELLDGRGRVLTRTYVAATGGTAITAERIETPRAELRVHALDVAGQLVGQAVQAYRVRGRTDARRWPIHFNNYPAYLPQPLLIRHLETSASLGISGYFLLASPSPTEDDTIRAADHLGIPYVVQGAGWLFTSGGTAPDGTGGLFSLTNAEAVAAGMTRDTNAASALAATNVLYYRLADDEPDPPHSDVSFDPATLARYYAWLAATYGYADSVLQREWGATATFATPASITPLSYAATVAAFNTRLTYAAWVDHRLFMMDLFSRTPALAREALQHGDPDAITGTSGDNVMSMAAGRDWWVRGQALDLVGRYAPSTAIVLKALGTLSIPWTGYDDPDPIIRHRVSNSLALGEDGMALFTETTLVNPDLSLPEVGRDLAAALLPVYRGVGGLFAASQPADDGVFVLASPHSSAVLTIHGYENLGAWVSGTPPAQVDLGTAAREGVHELLAAMGVGWRAISPSDVETGALERRQAKLLILPMCAALSDPACEAIRRWVAAGGRVIADLLPGTFSAHGRLRGTGISATGSLQGSTNPLGAVFGLTPGARPPIANTQVSVGIRAAFAIRCADTALVATPAVQTGGTAAGGIPLWFQIAYELGRAAYLGCSLFADYPIATRADRLLIEEAFSALLVDLGVAPRAQVTDVAGHRVELCQFGVRSVGSTELVVLLRSYLGIYDPVAPETDGELVFQTAAHTYDLENGVYLGYGDRLKLRVSAYTFRVFARLPYRVRGIDVQVASGSQLGDTLTVTAALTVDGGQAGRHRLRLDALDSKGRALRYLAREQMVDCGAATFAVPTAFNDPPGLWTLVVTDVATGVQGKLQINLGVRYTPVPEQEPLQIDGVDD